MERFYRNFAFVAFLITGFEFLYLYFYGEPLVSTILSTPVNFLFDLLVIVILYQQSRVLHYKNLCNVKDEIMAQRLPPEGSDLQL